MPSLRAPARRPLLQLAARVLILSLIVGLVPLEAAASISTYRSTALPSLPLASLPSQALPRGEAVVCVIAILAGGASELTETAFGEQIAHTGTDPQPYSFAGEPLDPNSGFQYHRARWYAPGQGVFTSMDPHPGLEFEPPTLHRYLYAAADPSNKMDPSGREFSLATLSLTAGLISGLASAAITAYRGGNVQDIVVSGVVTGVTVSALVYAFGKPGGGTAATVMGSVLAMGRFAGASVTVRFISVVLQSGVRLTSKGTPPTPGGIGTNAFGQLMQWGTGAQAALQRIQTLTPQELARIGVTVEIATRWRDFYVDVAIKNPANTSAIGRAILMHHIVGVVQ